MFKVTKIEYKNKFISPIISISKLPIKAQRYLAKDCSSRGFTLLEVMFSMLIIVIVTTATIYANVTTANTGAAAYHMSVVSFLAQNKLEEFKTTSYADITPSASAEIIGIYERSWTVSETSGLKTITVTVIFPSSSTTLNSVTLTTIRADI